MKKLVFLSIGLGLSTVAPSFADTVNQWSCYENGGTSYVDVFVSATLSSSAKIHLDNTAIVGAHTVDGLLVTAALPSGTNCGSVVITVVDGGTTYN